MSDTPAAPPPSTPPASAPPVPAQSPPPRRSRPWLTVLLCVLIFLAGGVAGGGAVALHVARRFMEAVRHPEVIPDRIVARIRRPLDLDPQQELQIKAILVRRQATLLEARAAALQRAGPEFDGIEDDVAAVLRPEQVERWHELYEHFRDEWMPEGGPDGHRREALKRLRPNR